MNLRVETEIESDGRWIAEVIDLPGVLTYGATRDEAVAKAKTLALRVIADRIEHGEAVPETADAFIVSPGDGTTAPRLLDAAGVRDSSLVRTRQADACRSPYAC